MKRFHVHVSVADLSRSVTFYRSLFGQEPDVLKDDYAKWMLDDPRINFAISRCSGKPGISHVGLQVETTRELGEIRDRLQSAAEQTIDQASAECCYASSTKTWVRDPDAISWETFMTHGEITRYGDDLAPEEADLQPGGRCCA